MRHEHIVPGVSKLWGLKIALSHRQGPWLIQQATSYDMAR